MILLGLGSNVDAEVNLPAGVRALQALGRVERVSPVYRCPAWGFAGDDFFNAALALRSELNIAELAAACRAIEHRFGRPRHAKKFADRQLDIDLLMLCDNDEQPPGLPRADILQHWFVLRPLQDIAGEQRHPVAGQTLSSLAAEGGQPLSALQLQPLDLRQALAVSA